MRDHYRPRGLAVVRPVAIAAVRPRGADRDPGGEEGDQEGGGNQQRGEALEDHGGYSSDGSRAPCEPGVTPP